MRALQKKRADDRENDRLVELDRDESARLENLPDIPSSAKIIDISTFVSPDSLQYQ